ncbi:hypothetical protein KC853_00250 [Candidatus Saccharibacteria bacterium]|mgnify:CR=1 FL=1|nr:hypothetical protein [Candidatus Saccharibacteria bacterium]MCB9835048.1 hypothetical protein [Candidatus Nomurabacteria bacterium]
MTKTVITICSSAAFYRQAVEIQDQLSRLGVEVIVPKTATRMKESDDFDVSHYKTWFADANDYHKKAELMRAHFEEIEKSNAILVLNYEKHGVDNYIGGNVLMEMALAFWLKKPIFIMNGLPEKSAFEEEIKGMEPILLHGDANALPKLYEEIISM